MPLIKIPQSPDPPVRPPPSGDSIPSDLDFSWELNTSIHHKIRLFLLLAPGSLVFLLTLIIMNWASPKQHIYLALGGFSLTLWAILKGGNLVKIYDKRYKKKRLDELNS
jgi:hypothetical protein